MLPVGVNPEPVIVTAKSIVPELGLNWEITGVAAAALTRLKALEVAAAPELESIITTINFPA